jgi:hypothetical protein
MSWTRDLQDGSSPLVLRCRCGALAARPLSGPLFAKTEREACALALRRRLRKESASLGGNRRDAHSSALRTVRPRWVDDTDVRIRPAPTERCRAAGGAPRPRLLPRSCGWTTRTRDASGAAEFSAATRVAHRRGCRSRNSGRARALRKARAWIALPARRRDRVGRRRTAVHTRLARVPCPSSGRPLRRANHGGDSAVPAAGADHRRRSRGSRHSCGARHPLGAVGPPLSPRLEHPRRGAQHSSGGRSIWGGGPPPAAAARSLRVRNEEVVGDPERSRSASDREPCSAPPSIDARPADQANHLGRPAKGPRVCRSPCIDLRPPARRCTAHRPSQPTPETLSRTSGSHNRTGSSGRHDRAEVDGERARPRPPSLPTIRRPENACEFWLDSRRTTTLPSAVPVFRNEAVSRLPRRDRAPREGDPYRPLRDRLEAAKPLVVSAERTLGRAPLCDGARTRKSSRHTLDGPLSARGRHPRNAGRRFCRLLAVAWVHPYERAGRGVALRPRERRHAGDHRSRLVTAEPP